MKLPRFLLTLGTILSLALFAPAAEKKTPPPKPAGPDAGKPQPTAAKALPFNTEVDALEASGFTHKNKDGTTVKNTVTADTVVMQGKEPAKFADVKVGDTVAGLRTKANAEGTEWTVIKITKFGPKPAKAKK
jgi:hypothetical protein